MENKHEVSTTTSSATLFQNIGNRLNPMNYDKVLTASQYFGSGIQKWRDGSFLLDINLVGRLFGGGSGGMVKGITPRRRLHGPTSLKTWWLQEQAISRDDIHDHCETQGHDDESTTLEPPESITLRSEWNNAAKYRETDSSHTQAEYSIKNDDHSHSEDENDVQLFSSNVYDGRTHTPNTNAEHSGMEYESCNGVSASILNYDYFQDDEQSSKVEAEYESNHGCDLVDNCRLNKTVPDSFHNVSEPNTDDCYETVLKIDDVDSNSHCTGTITPRGVECCISPCASYTDKYRQVGSDYPPTEIADDSDLTDKEVETYLTKHEDEPEIIDDQEHTSHPAFLKVRDGFVSCRILTPSLEEEIRSHLLEDDSQFDYLTIQDGRVCFRSRSSLDRQTTDAFKNDDTFSIARLFSEKTVTDSGDLDMGVIYIRKLFIENKGKDQDVDSQTLNELFEDLASVFIHLFSEDNQLGDSASDFENDDFNISQLFHDTSDIKDTSNNQLEDVGEETLGLTDLFCEPSENRTTDIENRTTDIG